MFSLNDIKDWLAEKNGENNEIGDNLDALYSEEEEIDSKEYLEKNSNLKNLKIM